MHSVLWKWAVVFTMMFFGGPLFLCAQDSAHYFDLGKKAYSEGEYNKAVEYYSKAIQPSGSPTYFCFDYQFEPEPGKRIWIRVDEKAWIERYPSGKESRFTILKHSTVEQITGTIVEQIKERDFHVFIPDKTDGRMDLKFKAPWTEGNWRFIGEMKNVEYDIKFPHFFNALAWLLATCPDDKYRNGEKAVEYATKACELDGGKSANLHDTLAAAFAEIGDFDRACAWQEKAIELLSSEKEKQDFRTRLKLFEQGRPHREKLKPR
jgi:tetratricopeptide (TPR) repeat protein